MVWDSFTVKPHYRNEVTCDKDWDICRVDPKEGALVRITTCSNCHPFEGWHQKDGNYN